MSLFAAVVRTVVNVATLPVAIAKDIFTLGGVATGEKRSYTVQKIEQIKTEADS